jgi:hypothetical protein
MDEGARQSEQGAAAGRRRDRRRIRELLLRGCCPCYDAAVAHKRRRKCRVDRDVIETYHRFVAANDAHARAAYRHIIHDGIGTRPGRGHAGIETVEREMRHAGAWPEEKAGMSVWTSGPADPST